MLGIIEVFRITLENYGKGDVDFNIGGQLQRRKNRIQNLDVPLGMPRNLSETHLLQFGTKAISNVAGQFSKLSQTFSPKVRTGKKVDADASTTDSDENITIERRESTDSAHEAHSTSADQSNIEENPIYAENSHMAGVGIVMASNSDEIDAATRAAKQSKLSENVSRLSISSVMDNVSTPNSMLVDIVQTSDTSLSPRPEIHVQNTDGVSNLAISSNLKFCQSAHEFAG